MLSKLLYAYIFTMSAFCVAEEPTYIDDDDFSVKNDSFYIHLGHNVWINTDTVHRDKTGLYFYESSIKCSVVKSGKTSFLTHDKTWKCPYCYSYWPIGRSCGNKDCPSKYK